MGTTRAGLDRRDATDRAGARLEGVVMRQTPGGSAVALRGVTKRFGDVVAVDDLTLEIVDREFLVLLGPSGCGKSTVLRLVAGLEDPDEGAIEIGGEPVDDVEPKDRDLAMVFQSYALYPQMTVARNIEFPLRARGFRAEDRNQMVDDAARMLGLEELLDRRPAQLSGGQRQRVALARAVVRHPRAFLLDEPLSNLDAKLRVQTRAELAELHRRLAATVLYVTHDQAEAMTMGQRIAVMNRGVLQQIGPPQDVYDRPANLFVARFIGSPPMSTLPADVVTSDDGRTSVRTAGGALGLAPGLERELTARGLRKVVVGVRPEHLVVDPDGPLAATVSLVESLGHEQHVIVRFPDEQVLVARVGSELTAPTVGEAVHLRPLDGHLHLFDPDTEARIDG